MSHERWHDEHSKEAKKANEVFPLTEKQARKLIERTAKRDAYQAVMGWMKSKQEDESRGSGYWYAKTKYEGHKEWTDEHDYFYDYSTGEVKLKP